MTRGMVWFKNDLRLHDNEALCNAIAECDELVFCFCVEESLFKKLSLGFRKADINRFKFLEQSVTNLQKKLEDLKGHLLIGSTSAESFLPDIIERYGISNLYAEAEYASEELRLIERVKSNAPDVQFNFTWGKTLYHIDDIPFKINSIPLTSKAYRIPTSKQAAPRAPLEMPTKLNSALEAISSPFPSCTLFGFTQEEVDQADSFMTGGEDAALKRLEYYTFQTELLTGYRWTRNRSMGYDYSSKFSPYLALGCISPREIYNVVQDYEQKVKKNQSTWWIIFELVWRDYFTFKGMRFGDAIFKTEGFKKKKPEFTNDQNSFEKWCQGQTGIPFVDAHMRQLNQTGYMSNRGRVNCASYMIHDLQIDWTWGAAYFESRLIDYDLSANWLNWHMQAFEIWYTNPVHQSNKYKAQEYIRKWISELATADDIAALIPWEFTIAGYPKPIEVYKKWTRSINAIRTNSTEKVDE
jgi:deoxyribodipyrimidine photo-lyase